MGQNLQFSSVPYNRCYRQIKWCNYHPNDQFTMTMDQSSTRSNHRSKWHLYSQHHSMGYPDQCTTHGPFPKTSCRSHTRADYYTRIPFSTPESTPDDSRRNRRRRSSGNWQHGTSSTQLHCILVRGSITYSTTRMIL